jgi:SAM-dependent methyltransferase
MISNETIDGGRAFDWGRTSKDYAKYRDIYPESFYEKIVELGLCTVGQDVLDLGTGTGVIPRHMARFGARFTGADISENQIREAISLTKEAGLSIDYVVSSAEEVSFPDGSFDVITACQCFMYFDRKIVFPLFHRLLRKDGHFAILFMAWLPDECEIAKRSEELVLKYNPFWEGAHFKRIVPSMPSEAAGLFEVKNVAVFDLIVPFTRETWHGRMRACRGIGASSLPDQVIADWEVEHRAFMETVPEEFEIKHYATILDLAKLS